MLLDLCLETGIQNWRTWELYETILKIEIKAVDIF